MGGHLVGLNYYMAIEGQIEKEIMVILGTRPEAIKMCLVVLKLKTSRMVRD